MSLTEPGQLSVTLAKLMLSIGLAVLSTISMASFPLSAQPAFNFEPIGEARGWGLGFDQGNQICAAYAGYESGTLVLVGLMGTDPVWFMELRNVRWASIESGQPYDAEFIFDGRRQYQGEQSGIINGLWTEGMSERFMEDFAQSSSMEIRFKGTRVDRLNLTGTRAATNAIKECHASRIENSTDPFAVANNDPFASSTVVSESGMCTGTIINTPVELLGGETTDFYEVGDRENYITQKGRDKNRVFYCSWGGSCIYSDYLRLDNTMRIRGDSGAMSGAEVRNNAFETDTPCDSGSLLDVSENTQNREYAIEGTIDPKIIVDKGQLRRQGEDKALVSLGEALLFEEIVARFEGFNIEVIHSCLEGGYPCVKVSSAGVALFLSQTRDEEVYEIRALGNSVMDFRGVKQGDSMSKAVGSTAACGLYYEDGEYCWNNDDDKIEYIIGGCDIALSEGAQTVRLPDCSLVDGFVIRDRPR